MIIYTFAAACILGLLRWPVWTVLVLAVATLIGYLGVGAGWDPNVWQPYNNPIFVDLVMKLRSPMSSPARSAMASAALLHSGGGASREADLKRRTLNAAPV